MKVVLKHAGRWLHFSNPARILQTMLLDQVLPLLREAENSGLFAAGFIAFEAAPAFDEALVAHESDGFPLLSLGLFHAPDILDSIEAVPSTSFSLGELVPSVSKDSFCDAIRGVREHIAAGDTYQVNYTYRLKSTFSGDPWTFFHELVSGQKTEHAAYVESDEFAICSVSPELFFSMHDGVIVSRPMKGTARRGMTFAEDWQQAQALQASEKDRAENIMIVDMIRNDIGRIADPGSVETVSRFDVEKYPTVWQMTSTVQGRIKPRTDTQQNGLLSEVLRALFPCASITGAPKAKTMEIIRALETTPRKIYTGSIGFCAPNGEACFNVAIRTALIDRREGFLEYGVGGGIVWDSEPESEYEETLTKARILTEHRPEFRLLETMRWDPDQGIYLLDEHLQRLGKSAAYFDIQLDIFAVQSELDRTVSSLDSGPNRLRLLVDQDGAIEVQAYPLETCYFSPALPADEETLPAMSIALARQPVNSADRFLYHKTTHRSVYEHAKSDFSGCDEVILWNECGEVTEGCITNVVIRRGDRLITPPVSSGLLAGTFREHLLKSGRIEEEVVTIEELCAADSVFLVNSIRTWQKAVWAETEESR